MGPAKRKLQDFLLCLPYATVRKLVVLCYCGSNGVKDTHIADSIIDDPKELLVGQLAWKGTLADCIRKGLAMFDPDQLPLFDEAA
jgi:hypothetical protein